MTEQIIDEGMKRYRGTKRRRMRGGVGQIKGSRGTRGMRKWRRRIGEAAIAAKARGSSRIRIRITYVPR